MVRVDGGDLLLRGQVRNLGGQREPDDNGGGEQYGIQHGRRVHGGRTVWREIETGKEGELVCMCVSGFLYG